MYNADDLSEHDDDQGQDSVLDALIDEAILAVRQHLIEHPDDWEGAFLAAKLAGRKN